MNSNYPTINDPSADIVLETSDSVQFPVTKAILMVASPFFEQMFTLPQPEESSVKTEFADQPTETVCTLQSGKTVEIVKIPEDATTLDHLLRIIYPVKFARLRAENSEDVEIAHKLLTAATKYEIPVVIQEICEALTATITSQSSSVTPSSAIRIYAIACRHGLAEEARAAAHACLYGQLCRTYVPELEFISAGAYYRLLEYHHEVALKAADCIQNLEYLPDEIRKTVRCNRLYTNNDFARWWLTFVQAALKIVKIAPLSHEIYSSNMQAAILSLANECNCCKNSIHGKWHTMERAIKERISEMAETVSLTWVVKSYHMHSP
jgi:hypothetical protein